MAGLNDFRESFMRIFGVMFVFLVTCTGLFAQGGHKKVKEGNSLYAEEKYDEANNKYRDALLENPDSPIVNFNIGDVLYKKKNYEEAIKSYQKSLSADERLLQSKSHYNIGNALYKMGKLPESIAEYKEALKLNPKDEDAKYNLEYVRAKLKDNSKKQKSQNNQQQQQQNQEQQQQDQKKQQDKQDQQQKEQQKQDQQQQQQDEDKKNEQNQEQQAEPGEKKEISKEDAKRILDALKNEEKNLLKKRKVKGRSGAYRGKDW